MARHGLIGILGRSRAGKDTVAACFRKLDPELRVARLSDPLKRAAAALFDFSQEQLEGTAKDCVDERYGCTPREAVTWLSVHALKHMGPSFLWTRTVGVETLNRRVVVPDIRTVHDVAELRRRGGVLVKVVRPDLPFRDPSEDHIDAVPADVVFYNVGSLEDMDAAVRAMAMTAAPCDEE